MIFNETGHQLEKMASKVWKNNCQSNPNELFPRETWQIGGGKWRVFAAMIIYSAYSIMHAILFTEPPYEPRQKKHSLEDRIYEDETKKLRHRLKQYFYTAVKYRDHKCSLHAVKLIFMLLQILRVILITSQVSMDTHSCVATMLFSFYPPFLIKVNSIYTCRRKLSFQSRPHLWKTSFSKIANRMSQKQFPLVTMAEKRWQRTNTH